MRRITIWLAATSLAIAIAGCGGSGGKVYDISPIFPLSADTCERYNGEESGEGFGATCMVTKDDCERAVSDWNQTMSDRGVQDAMRFSCD